jgi:hypothetical protein
LVAACAGACRSSAASSRAITVQTLSDSLRALHMPSATLGVMTRDTTWRVFVAVDSARDRTLQLYLIHPVANLVLPDGPFELLAPLTYFRFEDERWRQSTQDRGGVRLPAAVSAALATEFTDRERVYFYRVRVVDVSEAGERVASVPLRRTAHDMAGEVARLRKAGFIGGDAEP